MLRISQCFPTSLILCVLAGLRARRVLGGRARCFLTNALSAILCADPSARISSNSPSSSRWSTGRTSARVAARQSRQPHPRQPRRRHRNGNARAKLSQIVLLSMLFFLGLSGQDLSEMARARCFDQDRAKTGRQLRSVLWLFRCAKLAFLPNVRRYAAALGQGAAKRDSRHYYTLSDDS